MRLTMKPGVERACTGVLPQRLLSSKIAAATSASVCEPGDDLDQLHQRHRVEEVHADEPAGCSRPLASAVIEIDEVLVASTRPRADHGLELAEERALGIEVLDDRLDDQAARAPASSSAPRGAIRPAWRRLRRASSLPLAARPSSVAPSLCARLLRGAVARVEQLHGVAGLRRHLGDASAHDAGADDEDRSVAAVGRSFPLRARS